LFGVVADTRSNFRSFECFCCCPLFSFLVALLPNYRNPQSARQGCSSFSIILFFSRTLSADQTDIVHFVSFSSLHNPQSARQGCSLFYFFFEHCQTDTVHFVSFSSFTTPNPLAKVAHSFIFFSNIAKLALFIFYLFLALHNRFVHSSFF